MTPQWIGWTGLALMALGGPVWAAAQVSTIDAKSNIFYAGTVGMVINTSTAATANTCTYAGAPTAAQPYNNKLGNGKVPPYLSITSGVRSLQIVAKNTAAISYGTNYRAQPGSTPDGTLAPLRAQDDTATSVWNQSNTTNQGLAFLNRFGVLASVFTNDTMLTDSMVTYTASKQNMATFTSATMNAASVSPAGLRDAFFIGDGTVVDFVDKNWPTGRPTTGGATGAVAPGVSPAVLPTGAEQRQNIQPPDGATRMYFGVVDGAFITGPNCSYQDNAGGIDITLKLTISDDSGAGKAGEAKTVIPSVLFNDTVDGGVPVVDGSTAFALSPVAPASLPIHVSATDAAGSSAWDPAVDGISLDTTTGAVSIAATTAGGIYKKWYQLCDSTTQPASCAVALATIEVAVAPVVLAGLQDQAAKTAPIAAPTVAIANVRANDTVDTQAATATNSTIAKDGVWNGFALDTTTGAVSIEQTSFGAYPAAGTYTMSYKLCAAGSTTNCTSVPVVITITAAALPVLQAVADSAGTVLEGTGGTALVNALANDTYANGAPGSATTANVTVVPVPGAVWPAGVSMDSAGNVSVATTTAAGNYTLAYQICDKTVTTQCSASTISLVVQAVTISAADDAATATSGTAAPNVVNVLAGDLYNNAVASMAEVVISPPVGWPASVSLDTATGAVSVAASAAAGLYNLPYEICSQTVAGRCASAFVRLVVNPAPPVIPPITPPVTPTVTVTAADDAVATKQGVDSAAVVNVLAGDLYNGAAANLSQVTIAPPVGWPAGVTLNTATGAVSVAATVAAGNYDLPYTICATTSATTCANAFVRLTVTATTPPPAVATGPAPVPGLGQGALAMLSLLAAALGWMGLRRRA